MAEFGKLGEAKVEITADTKKLRKGFKQTEAQSKKTSQAITGHLEKIRRKISRVRANVLAWKFAYAAAAAGIVLFTKNSIKAFNEQERVEAQLDARLKSTRMAAGLTSKALRDMASSLQSVTTFGDEATIGMQSLLLTFTNIRGDVFKGATEAVMNVATAMGSDLKSAAIQVGKALNDPILGVTALARSGIQFTESQKGMIKSLVETGQTAKAQGLILEELETQFGGAARAARETFGGTTASLANTFGDTMEHIGKMATMFGPSLAFFNVKLAAFNDIIDRISGTSAKKFAKSLQEIREGLVPLLTGSEEESAFAKELKITEQQISVNASKVVKARELLKLLDENVRSHKFIIEKHEKTISLQKERIELAEKLQGILASAVTPGGGLDVKTEARDTSALMAIEEQRYNRIQAAEMFLLGAEEHRKDVIWRAGAKQREAHEELMSQYRDQKNALHNMILTPMSAITDELIAGAGSFADAWENASKAIMSMLSQLIAQMITLQIMSLIFTGGLMPLGKTFSLASGIDIGLFGKQSSPQLAPAGGGMGQPVEIHSHINIDGREVGIAVNRYNRFNKRSS